MASGLRCISITLILQSPSLRWAASSINCHQMCTDIDCALSPSASTRPQAEPIGVTRALNRRYSLFVLAGTRGADAEIPTDAAQAAWERKGREGLGKPRRKRKR